VSEETPKGQVLERIQEKDYLYYDVKSLMIYWIKRGVGELEKCSSGIRLDNSNPKARETSIRKALREIPRRLDEIKQRKLKSQKKRIVKTQKLMGEYIDEMTYRTKLVEALDENGKVILNEKGEPVMKEIISGFHKSKKKPVSDKSLKSYQTSTKHLKPFFENYLPSELVPSPDDPEGEEFVNPWLLFVEDFQKKNPGFNMFNVTKHMISLTNYLHEIGVIPRKAKIFNPYSEKERVERRKKTNRTYTLPEVTEKMLPVCDEDQEGALWLGYNEALRPDDCVRLSWDRLDLGEKPFIQWFGDDNKATFYGRTPLSDVSAEWLRQRKKRQEDQGLKTRWVFPQRRDPTKHLNPQTLAFEKVIRASGVNFGSHKFMRHTRLTEDFGNPELDNAMVMKIRRVSLKVALEHYIHPTDADFEKFRNTTKAKKKEVLND
jgi:integrase